MHRDGATRAELGGHLHGLLGIKVRGPHDLFGAVGTNRQRRQVGGTQPFPDLTERIEAPGISGEVESPPTRLYEPACPQRAVAVEQASPAPVLCRHSGDPCAGDLGTVPPVELGGLHTCIAEQVCVGQWNEDPDPPASEPSQGLLVHVIVVVVRHHGEIDLGQVLHAQARGDVTLGAESRRAGGARPDGVGQERHSAHLHEKRGVPDPCHQRGIVRLA